MKTAQQAAANWIGSAGRAQADWSAGVQGYQGDWAGATVRQQSVLSRQASAIAKILQAEAAIVGSLPPRGTFEQNKMRATAVMDSLHALKGTLGAS